MLKKIVTFFFFVIIGFSIISIITTKIVYDRSFPRFPKPDETITATISYQDIEDEYPRRTVLFNSNPHQLQGYVYEQEDAIGLIVIIHGLGGGAESYLPYMMWFFDHGWSVFMYDATGSHESEGTSTIGFPQSIIDLEHALNYIDTDDALSTMDVVLFGHSWGGYAAANVLHLKDDIKAVVTVAAPYDADTFVFEQVRARMGGFAYIQKPFLNMYQQSLFKAYADMNAIDAIEQSSAHVMVIQGRADELVTYDHTAIYAKKTSLMREDVHFHLIEEEGRNGHQHLFRSDDALAYIEQINIDYRVLYDAHNGEIPYEIKQQFYLTIDRHLAQSLDEGWMQTIHTFYLNALTA